MKDNRGDTLLALADLYDGRREDGSYDNTSDAFNAIRCVDDPRVDDRAIAAKQDTEYRRVAPFLDDGRGTGAAPWNSAPPGRCPTPPPRTRFRFRICRRWW